MIYLILPPIIIVLAVGLLILLLVRRSKEKHFHIFAGRQQQSQPAAHHHTAPNYAQRQAPKPPPLERFARLFHVPKPQLPSFRNFRQGRQRPLREEDVTVRVPENAQDLIQQSTLSFIRRRVLLQEQRRHSSSAGSDVSAPEDQPHMQYSAEEDEYVTRLAEDPFDIDAYEKLGTYYFDRKNYDDARECFKQILKIQPRNRRAQTAMQYIDRKH